MNSEEANTSQRRSVCATSPLVDAENESIECNPFKHLGCRRKTYLMFLGFRQSRMCHRASMPSHFKAKAGGETV